MQLAPGGLLRSAFAPPRYLAPSLSGIDLSTSGVKAVELSETPAGLVLARFSQTWLPSGAYDDGKITDHAAVVTALRGAAEEARVRVVNAALPEPKSYLFETEVPGLSKEEWHIAIEQHLAELVPLPPQETDFDVVEVGMGKNGGTMVAGVGFSRRLVDETLSVLDEAGLDVRALEGESFAMARALLPHGDQSTTLIIDVGKTTTKMAIVTHRIPRFTTTIGVGGHALTLAVQKYFGVTETEARRVKTEHGIVPEAGNEEYLASMLSTLSVIREEIAQRLEYWQSRANLTHAHEPVTQVILAGGNASIRGFPEYLEGSFGIPVMTGDVFTNLASRDAWLPPIEYAESLAYATAIGLALREHAQS